MKPVPGVPLNGSQPSGQHLPEDLDIGISANVFFPVTRECARSQS